jgi:peptide/nickel transport system substrate-binding protein
MTTADDDKRAELTSEAQKSFVENDQFIPLYSPDTTLFMNKDITGPAVSGLQQLYYPWAATIGAS